MCLTINQPFYVAFICGQCLNNVHGEADYSSCFEIGGSQMEDDKPYVDVHTTFKGVMLNAARRGHHNYSNVYWKRAPPAQANTDTSDFFIRIKAGFQFGYKNEDKVTNEIIGFRAHARESGFTLTAHVQLKAKKFDEATFTCMAPKFTCPGLEKPLVLTTQVKLQDTKVTEMKLVAETKLYDGLDLKLKASKAPKHPQGQVTVSTIFRKLPGDYDLTLGATCNLKDNKLQYGALLQHGYYSFVGW